MPLMFAELVPEGIDLSTLMLVRHHTTKHGRGNTPFDLWRDEPEQFEAYQRCQARNVFQRGNYLASFVVTPFGDTLFVGLFKNNGEIEPPPNFVEPLSDWEISKEKKRHYYNLYITEMMSEYIGKLSIDWGEGALAWVQYASRRPKPVVQISKSFIEESFPGLNLIVKRLSEIARLPQSWIARLREARGIYVLSCPNTHELYIGSATGEGGFYDRWLQHAKFGGDAKVLRSREPSDYQVAIVEVAGSVATRSDILHSEYLWMLKLQTNQMGLNGGMLRDGKEKPITVAASQNPARDEGPLLDELTLPLDAMREAMED